MIKRTAMNSLFSFLLGSKECCICIENIKFWQKGKYAHDDENGHQHPIHQKCWNQFLAARVNTHQCPSCRAPLPNEQVPLLQGRDIVIGKVGRIIGLFALALVLFGGLVALMGFLIGGPPGAIIGLCIGLAIGALAGGLTNVAVGCNSRT